MDSSMTKKQNKNINIRTPKKKLCETNVAMWYNKVRKEKQLAPSYTECPKKIEHFFFIFVGSQCVESGVSCTDCY